MSMSKEDKAKIISNFNDQNLQPLVKAFKGPIEAASFLHQNKGQLDSKVTESLLEGRVSVGDDDSTDLVVAYNAIGNLKNGKLQDALNGLSELDITKPNQIADFFYKNRYEVKSETLQKMLNSDGMQDVSNEFNIRRDNDAIKLFQKTFNNKDEKNEKLSGINTTKDIADYLHSDPTLDKEKLGEYLSHDSCLGVLDGFTKKMDFSSKGFVDGMRAYLNTFKLPGEAQRIDRIMESFGKHYVANGKDSEQFASADAAYVMAFNTVALNTSLHNPSVKNKTSLLQFQSMGRDLLEGNKIQYDQAKFNQFACAIYRDIKKEEFKFVGKLEEKKPDHKLPMKSSVIKHLSSIVKSLNPFKSAKRHATTPTSSAQNNNNVMKL